MREFALKPNEQKSDRSFEISQIYSGCPNDRGWLLITTKENNPCDFEKYNDLSIIYSNQENVTIYSQRGK